MTAENESTPGLREQVAGASDYLAGESPNIVPHGPVWRQALADATEAIRRGWHVFPIGRAKLPAIRSPHRDDPPGTPKCRGECGRPGHGVHDATDDEQRLAELFATAPHATGYGIACGRGPLPLLGVDLDRKNGVDGVASLRALADEHGFTIEPTTAIATPSGGWHLWFTGPADARVPNSAGKLGPGIDVRGYGGYLVGPGSWTSRGVYRFAEPHPVAPIPTALLDLIVPAPLPRRTVTVGRTRSAALTGLVKYVLDSREGQRNERLYWAAQTAFKEGRQRGIAPQAITGAMAEAAALIGLSESEARHTIESAYKSRNAR
ncbi:bifunctional DNA primase/polymerase [Streptomyces violens]|uniref:bifunctional DNA primase/polymerase n=1 Tax=Streptomyces violens TaxID=66377 RepID=UPI000996A099|nr:bifunctional DNA primase/polymerase [Streptomyces violens]